MVNAERNAVKSFLRNECISQFRGTLADKGEVLDQTPETGTYPCVICGLILLRYW